MSDAAWIIAAIAWILGGVWAGRATREKGYGWLEGWIPALLFSPVFGVLYAAALPDRGPPAPTSPSTNRRAAVARPQ